MEGSRPEALASELAKRPSANRSDILNAVSQAGGYSSRESAQEILELIALDPALCAHLTNDRLDLRDLAEIISRFFPEFRHTN